MTNWKKLLEETMSDFGETLADIESSTLSESEIIEMFGDGYGGTEGTPFTVWTKNSVYFPICYDGAEWAGRVARHPDGKPTDHQGGG